MAWRQNNTLRTFTSQKEAVIWSKKGPPKPTGPKVRNNKSTRKPKVGNIAQDFWDKNSRRENIRVTE